MQSTASTWFCTTCGAANDVGQTVCFSCHQARAEHPHTQPAGSSTLLHGRYRLIAQVGVGGFGEVYKAVDTRCADRAVAIKQINLRGLTPQKMIEATDTFNREVRILPQLQHPNLPCVYDHFTDPDHWYLVMEYLEGETLERYLETRLRQRSYAGTTGLLPLEDIFALAFQLCDVLDYLHTLQPPVIFRDLKPANIMRTSLSHFSLIDFGIARLFTPGQTRDTTPLGSPGYAAPEQYGRAQTTPRSDLYSLGALLHYLLTGDDPSESPFQFAPLPESTLAGTQELDALIQRMVEVDSSQRPASAREVKEELQRIASRVAESAAPRIWYPPQAQIPDPEVIQTTGQQQIQLQIQKHKSTTRRKFLTRSLVGGSVVILGGLVIEPVLNALFSDSRPGPFGPGDFSGPGHFRQQQFISDIVWSPDGKLAAFISTEFTVHDGEKSTNSVFIYQVKQARGYSFFTGPPVISTLAWAPPATGRIAFGYADGTISLFDMNTQDIKKTVDGYQHNADGTISLFDMNTASSVLTYRGSIGQVESIAWSPDGTLIASGGVEEVVRICKASDGSVVSTYTGNSPGERRPLSWSPDSTRVVIEYAPQNAQLSQSTLQVWDAKAGKTLFTFADVNMLQVAWSPGGKLIASAGNDGMVYLWDASNGKLIKSYLAHDNFNIDQFRPVELLWSLDNKFLVLDKGGKFIQIWDTLNNASKLMSMDPDITRALIWLPNGLLAVIDSSKTTRIIDVSSL